MAAMRGVRGVLLLSLGTAVLCSPPISLQEGENAEFPCDHPAYQNPRVEWKFMSGTDTILVYYDGDLTAPYKTRATFFPQGLRLSSVTRKDGGEYSCEVTGKDASGTTKYFQDKTKLVVLVPPSVPVAQVPTSVSTGSTATLYCIEKDASPPPSFIWYKNGVPMPPNPKDSPTFQNSSYTIDSTTGQLRFSPVMKTDGGQYSCQAANPEGKEFSAPVQMEVKNQFPEEFLDFSDRNASGSLYNSHWIHNAVYIFIPSQRSDIFRLGKPREESRVWDVSLQPPTANHRL